MLKYQKILGDASVLLLAIVTAVAVSIFFSGSINPYMTGLSAVAVLIFWRSAGGYEIASNAPSATGDQSITYMLLGAVVLFCALLVSRPIPYMSLWGDVGVYINVAGYLAQGGSIPFAYDPDLLALETNQPLVTPVGMINPTATGQNDFHGLPTWPGVMALSQVFSGKASIALVVLAGLSILLFHQLLVRLNIGVVCSLIATTLFALNPVFVFQALYPTTEILSLTILLATSLLLCLSQHRSFILLVSSFAFGAVHPGIVILLPVLAIAALLYLCVVPHVARRRALKLALAISIGSLASYLYAGYVSGFYHSNIIAGLFGDREFLAYFALISPVIMIVALMAIESTSVGRLAIRKAGGFLVDRFTVVALGALPVCGFILVLQAYFFGWTEVFIPDSHNPYSSWSARVAYAGQGFSSLWHLSVVNIALASGIFGFLGFLLFPFGNQLRSPLLISGWFLVLMLLIVFGIYRIDIPNNFYASRYFVPHLVPGLFVFGALVLRRRRWARFTLAPFWILFSIFVLVQFAQGKFFSTDSALDDFLQAQVDFNDQIFVSGDTWFKHHLHGYVLRNYQRVEDAKRTRPYGVHATAALVTNDHRAVLGPGRCLSFTERRIPWTISYFQKPQLIDRRVCHFWQWTRNSYFHVYEGNSWLLDGSRTFVVMGSGAAENIEISIQSFGWWAGKAPFRSDLMGIRPTLTVCDGSFELKSVSPLEIVLQGKMPSGPCVAVLQTNIFIPSQIGEGPDTRSLGMDVSGLRVQRAR